MWKFGHRFYSLLNFVTLERIIKSEWLNVLSSTILGIKSRLGSVLTTLWHVLRFVVILFAFNDKSVDIWPKHPFNNSNRLISNLAISPNFETVLGSVWKGSENSWRSELNCCCRFAILSLSLAVRNLKSIRPKQSRTCHFRDFYFPTSCIERVKAFTQ